MQIPGAALILALLLGVVNTGVNEDSSGGGETVYSDWLRLEDMPGKEEGTETASGTRDLRALLREAALLDAGGSPLAEGDVWPVEPDSVYKVRLRFAETPGSAALQFGTEDGPLSYRLPDGLSAGETDLSLPLRIETGAGGTAEAVCLYSAAERTLSVQWDPDGETAGRIREA